MLSVDTRYQRVASRVQASRLRDFTQNLYNSCNETRAKCPNEDHPSGNLPGPPPYPVQRKLPVKNQYSDNDIAEQLVLDRAVLTF